MVETQTFGHSQKSLEEIAITLISIIEGSHSFPGGLYVSQRVLGELADILRLADDSPEEKLDAIVDAVENNSDVKFDPEYPEAHLIVDRLWCRDCHQRPCESHHRDTYKPPAEVATLAS